MKDLAMKARNRLYEGKAKIIYSTDDDNLYLIEFKDDATAFNGQKKGSITDKGIINNRLSAAFFQLVEKRGIPTHFVRLAGERTMLVKKVKIIPIEVVVRNIAAGSLCRRLGLAEGQELSHSIVEFYYKDDELGDPLINTDHAIALNLASREQLSQLRELGLKVNSILRDFLTPRGIDLVDFKLEFGTNQEGQILLADEISPDTCRFWDMATRTKLDKDRFRQDLGDIEAAYTEVLRRVVG